MAQMMLDQFYQFSEKEVKESFRAEFLLRKPKYF